jgi:hypothetical protein
MAANISICLTGCVSFSFAAGFPLLAFVFVEGLSLDPTGADSSAKIVVLPQQATAITNATWNRNRLIGNTLVD